MSTLSTGAVAGLAASSAIALILFSILSFILYRKYITHQQPRRFTMLGDDEFAYSKNETEAGYEFEERRYPKIEKEPRMTVSEMEVEAEEEKSIGGGNFSPTRESDRPGRGVVHFEDRTKQVKGHDKKAAHQTMIDARKSIHPFRSSSHQFISFDVSPPLTPLSPTFSTNLSPTREDFSPTTPTFSSFPPTPTSPSFPAMSKPLPPTPRPLLATRADTDPLNTVHTHSLSSPAPVIQIGTPPAAYSPRRTQTTTTKYGNHGPGVMGIGGVEGIGGNGKLEGDGGKRESFKGARSAWK